VNILTYKIYNIPKLGASKNEPFLLYSSLQSRRSFPIFFKIPIDILCALL
jgi:hypothetical protein